MSRPDGPIGRRGGFGGLAACVALALLAGGCAGAKMVHIADATEFQKVVIEADKPVLVEFYKAGCATCVLLEPGLDQLAEEYRGRAVVAKFELMTFFFGVKAKDIGQTYDIAFFPTVILFVNGQEKKRWVMHYALADYRAALNEYVRAPAADIAPAKGGQASHNS